MKKRTRKCEKAYKNVLKDPRETQLLPHKTMPVTGQRSKGFRCNHGYTARYFTPHLTKKVQESAGKKLHIK